MVVILELHRVEAAEGLSLQLVVVIAMLPLFLLQLNFHFHDTKPNEDDVTGCSPPILLLFLWLSLFMCDLNADSPLFEMLIIRSQHLHKAFFLSALNAVNQPLYLELSSHCRL